MGAFLTTQNQGIDKEFENTVLQTVDTLVDPSILFKNLEQKKDKDFYRTLKKLELVTNKSLPPRMSTFFLKEYIIHTQDIVTQPNKISTCHNYISWMTIDNQLYYGRSLNEANSQYEMSISKEEKEKLIEEYLNRFPNLKIQNNDSEQIKKEKEELISQIPHSFKLGEILFKRKQFVEDPKTSLLLPLYAQWLVEQVFKTGSDIYSKVPIEEMTKEQFIKQWGKNKVDLTNIYGTTEKITNALRLKKDGKMKTQKIQIGDKLCDFPPKLTFKTSNILDDEVSQNEVHMFIPKDFTQEQAETLYALGHPRFNLHFGMVMWQTIWIREHNRICEILKNNKNNKDWDDERIFQTARLICTGILLKVTVENYLSHFHQSIVNIKYDPTILFDTKFTYNSKFHYEFNFMYRWHSMVPDKFNIKGQEYEYKNVLFNPDIIKKNGIQNLVEMAMETHAGRLGLNNTPDFLQYLEITSLLHSRVLKTKSYNDYREYFGCDRFNSFDDITKDPELQSKLKEIYQNVDNIDWYVGFLAEDHQNGMAGELFQAQLGVYAFNAVFTCPLASKQLWNADTFTEEGFNIIQSSNMSDLINRNLQENDNKPFVNPNNKPHFDIFKVKNLQKEIKKSKEEPYSTSKQKFEERQRSIAHQKNKWPFIDDGKTPIYFDSKKKETQILFEIFSSHHTFILGKRQLKALIKGFETSVQTKTFASKFAKELSLLHAIADTPSFLTQEEVRIMVDNIDKMFPIKESNDLIDKIYGFVPSIYSKSTISKFKNFQWNLDKVFGDMFLNGPDPTQLRLFKKSMLNEQFRDFTVTSSYFEKTFKKKFLEEIEKNNVYYVDNYDIMSLITTFRYALTRPKALFYFNGENLLPIAIQLNNTIKSTLKINIRSVNLPEIEKAGLEDNILEFKIDNQRFYTPQLCQKEKWGESTIECERSDIVSIALIDPFEILSDQKINLKIADFKKGDFEISLMNGNIKLNLNFKDASQDYETSIYFPDHTNWIFAKIYLANSHFIHHQLVAHFLVAHSVHEAISMVLHHTMYQGHPIFKLLKPHLYFIELVNSVFRKAFVNEKGLGLISELTSIGPDWNKGIEQLFEKFDLLKTSFPEDIKERDIKIPNYQYAKDGDKVWNCIKKYVEKVLTYYYKNDDFSQDKELIAFVNMLYEKRIIKKADEKSPKPPDQSPKSPPTNPISPRTPKSGMGSPKFSFFKSSRNEDDGEIIKTKKEPIPLKEFKIEKVSDIVYLITTIIFNATAFHTIQHFSFLDFDSFSPILPSMLRKPPLSFKDKSFGPLKDNYILSPKQQKILSDYLPSPGTSIVLNLFVGNLSQETDIPLISDSYNLFNNDPGNQYFKEFQQELIEIANEIKKRNNYPYLSKMSQSVNV